MLALISSDKKYISNLLEEFTYSKEKSPKNTNLYKCNYKEHTFLIMSTGYGKVNIGSSLRFLCDNYDIRVLYQIGTAGSIVDTNDIFSVIIPSGSVQFDVDFMPNGYKPAMIPNIDSSIYKCNDDLINCAKEACILSSVNYSNDLIASSDMFVTNYNLSNSIRIEYNAGAVDCETAAVGEFAYLNDISYVSTKVISNYANNNGIKQYNLYDDEASNISQRIAHKFIKKYYE